MNRAIARRTAFENLGDYRYFTSLLARAVRQGRVEVHSFCLMATHFHLLVRSLDGNLSETMRWIQNRYVRRFNRQRKRDGPLFRGRFLSKIVEDDPYRCVLVRYIDFNPVKARLVVRPEHYPHGTACRFQRDSGPAWLARDWVETTVRVGTGHGVYDAAAYNQVFGKPLNDGLAALAEKQMGWRSGTLTSFDDVVAGSSSHVRAWMHRKARLADGTHPGMPVASVESTLDAIRIARQNEPHWTVSPTRKPMVGWLILAPALLKALCGLTNAQVASLMEISAATVSKRLADHRTLMIQDASYAEHAGELGREALRATGWGNAES